MGFINWTNAGIIEELKPDEMRQEIRMQLLDGNNVPDRVRWLSFNRLLLCTVMIISLGFVKPATAQESVSPVPSSEVLSSLRTDVVDTLQAWIPVVVDEDNIPGAAVVVVDRDEILWLGVFGHTDTSRTKKVTDRTLFSIQSMSKNFTALGLLQAVQDGLLDLDAPINSYLPGFSVKSRFEEKPGEKITLRHLLSHTAGFAHEAPIGNNYEDYETRPYMHTFEEHIQSISETWLKYPVGYCWSYSNMGVDCLTSDEFGQMRGLN